jgi:hypothetical protein
MGIVFARFFETNAGLRNAAKSRGSAVDWGAQVSAVLDGA